MENMFDLENLPPGVSKDDEDLFIKAQQVCVLFKVALKCLLSNMLMLTNIDKFSAIMSVSLIVSDFLVM
jgi:hypothetical protein